MSRVTKDPWQGLRSLTPARLALGRAGDALPTTRWLEFSLAHAQARDAVQAELDAPRLARDVQAMNAGWPGTQAEACLVASAARDRQEYLRRPDLGRRLSEASRSAVQAVATRLAAPPPLVIVLADGLSALAVQRHAPALLQALPGVLPGPFAAAAPPVFIATQARVALGDEVGELLGAAAVAVLIGERPGLSVADSLGVYFTWAPRVGCTDAQRNCLSNIHGQGLDPAVAARSLCGLLEGARRLGRSGVELVEGDGSSMLEGTLIPPVD
jgi:ethanolamine ammonia-lyase small subunit